MHPVNRLLNIALVNREVEGALRKLTVSKDLIDFCSNDYLGFATSNELTLLTERFRIDAENYKNGSSGSRLISGNSDLVEEVERLVAQYHGAEAGLIFNSGYDANIGLFSSLPQRGDTVIYDELIHASIRDGMRLSYAEHYSFIHNDLRHLEDKLKRAKGTIFVAVESVYSMDGDVAPLAELVKLCEKYHALLIVDEAHATGVFGKEGQGLVNELGLEKEIFVRVHTFGKALGSHGAIVVGTDVLRTFLINFARSFIYTTALPPHSLLQIKAAYTLLSQRAERIAMLKRQIAYFREKCKEIEGITLLPSDSAIQCVLLPGNSKVKHIAQRLQEHGFDVKAILSPTVPRGKERLRICIHSFNTNLNIDNLIFALVEAKDIKEQTPTMLI